MTRGSKSRPGKRARPGPKGEPAIAGLAARRAALFALTGVLRDKRMLSQIAAHSDLSPADAARAGRLAQMVLRHMGPIDRILARFFERTPAPAVRLILRLGAAELLIAKEDAHGVVNGAVALAKSGGPRTNRASGMINAVLRKIADDRDALWAEQSPQRLPGWIAGPVKKAYGEPALRAIEAAHAAGAPLDITPRDASVQIDGAERLPSGSLRLRDAGQVSALPGYADGTWWVQDAAAALPVRLLGDVRGKRVLDLCAAPGGKTLQLATAGADVVALDISEVRTERIRENLGRTDLKAEVVIGDALTHRGQYDAILLDAPCSATGTIRRHPDLPFVKSGADTEALTRLQMELLDHAISLLSTGVQLVFCTCSLLPVEGEFQVRAALKRHPGLRVTPADPETLGGDSTWVTAEGGLRLRPDFWSERGGMDGFYMASLTHD